MGRLREGRWLQLIAERSRPGSRTSTRHKLVMERHAAIPPLAYTEDRQDLPITYLKRVGIRCQSRHNNNLLLGQRDGERARELFGLRHANAQRCVSDGVPSCQSARLI